MSKNTLLYDRSVTKDCTIEDHHIKIKHSPALVKEERKNTYKITASYMNRQNAAKLPTKQSAKHIIQSSCPLGSGHLVPQSLGKSSTSSTTGTCT